MSVSSQNLFFRYEDQPILEDVSFEVKAGDFVGLFGPNGGGKTTLLKLLLGFLRPQRGKIQILGENPKSVQKKLGYVPQIKQFDKSFPISVKEVVMQGCLSLYRFFGGYPEAAKKRAHEVLEIVRLTDQASMPFGMLSGGQIQRTLIARALVSRPKVLFLDEATVGIDAETLQDIFAALRKMRGKITILMVTHDLQYVAKEMDQFLCINKTLSIYQPEEVCKHFAMGLYHPPLMQNKEEKEDV